MTNGKKKQFVTRHDGQVVPVGDETKENDSQSERHTEARGANEAALKLSKAEVGETEEKNYEKMTVKQLKALCRKRDVHIGHSRKAGLIQSLRYKDEGLTTLERISLAFSDDPL